MTLGENLIGAWALVSYTEQVLPDGPLNYPLGHSPLGLIMYTPDGYMSAQIMTLGRPAYDLPATVGGTAEQRATAAGGYLAYGGPYSVDETTGDIHHEVVVSLLPNWVGTTQIRRGHLTKDRLTLLAESTLPKSPTTVLSTLHWARTQRGDRR